MTLQINPRQRIAITFLACVVILKIVTEIVAGYRFYLPPDFSTEFLLDRESYFWNGYHIAFYAHIVAGPITLVLGLLLLSKRIRHRLPAMHRRIGQTQVAVILVLLVPSGLWMSFYAEPGPIARSGFVTLSLLTGISAWRGWRMARGSRYTEHAKWMARCFTLLASAVVLRLIGGAFEVAQIDSPWTYSFAAWASWGMPLACLEAAFVLGSKKPTVESRAFTERGRVAH